MICWKNMISPIDFHQIPLSKRAIIHSKKDGHCFIDAAETSFYLTSQGPGHGMKTVPPGLWRTPRIWSCPRGNLPPSTARRRAGPSQPLSGTRTVSEWRQTGTTRVPTACCFPAARSSFCASCMAAGANRTRASTPASPGTTWEKPWAAMLR